MEAKPENEAADLSADPPASSSGKKRKARVSDVVEPRTPLKRQRVPVSRFQSPLEDIPFVPEKEEKKKDENVTLYKKGAFLAVRGAEDTFYLCRTAQNIYSKSKRLRIQWLSLDSPPDVYKFDYVDTTEMETVLTEIQMEKISKDSYKLPSSEQRRAEKILDRAIRVEQGLATADEVEEEALEEVENELEESEEEDDDDDDDEVDLSSSRRSRSSKKSPKGRKGKATASAQKKKDKDKDRHQGKSSKQKGKGGDKKKGPDRNLKPNPKIKILEKDPFFETKDKVPDVSPLMTSKLIFRAINTGDLESLKELLAKTEGITNFEISRSAFDARNALDLAGEQGRNEMVKALVSEIFDSEQKSKKNRKNPPAPIITEMDTGVYNPAFLGIRSVRTLKVSRGYKEGNNAFLMEENEESIDKESVIQHWMKTGVPVETMETFILSLSAANKTTRDDELHAVIDAISIAVSRGNLALAAKYVSEAERLGGFGFNFLHKEVLSYEKEDLRDIILAASVRKKPFSNDSITPLHCAAINPNVKYITRLLSIEPDVNIQTKSNARPVHFAAACEGTGPLEFLIKRNASVNETDNSGNLPIHYASRSGRAKNIDVLVKHAKSEVDAVINEKWGIGMVNRPNRFSYCPLHMAVEEGQLDAVRTLIKNGADVNKPLSASKHRITPLMIAAQRGDLNIARLLVQNGANVEMLDRIKRSALTHAIINGSTNVASYLLYLGADPNRVDSSNNSLVHYAAAYGWYFCLKLLIKDAGAKPDQPNDWQTTPINIAFLKGNHGLVEMLFNHKGVDINFKTDSGMTLASIACRSRLVPGLDSQITNLINVYKADPTIRDVNGFNALHHLAANNIKILGTQWNPEVSPEAMQISVKIAELLISAKCDPTLRTNDGKTPIMLAIEQVNVELVKFLVEKGGTVSPDKNNDEKTVLHLMAEQCCTTDLTPMLKILAEHKPVESNQKPTESLKQNGKVNVADIPSEEKKEETPMEVDSSDKKPADDKGHSENNLNGGDSTTEVKHDTSSNPEAAVEKPAPILLSQQEVLKKMAQDRDFLGFTPLLRACFVYKNFQATKKDAVQKVLNARKFIEGLLEWTGSDVNAVVGPKNMPDEVELHYAPEGQSSSLHFMVNAASEKGEAEIGQGIKLLLKYSPNTNLRDLQDKTPLVLAVESSRETIVKSLLEGGADPNVLIKGPNFQVTPLVLAAERGAIEIMRLLIQYKADVQSSRSDNLRTPVHIMVTNRAREDETIAMIQALLQAGANINSTDSEGDTPLHLAVRFNKGHSDTSTSLEEFLLDRGANVFAKNKHQMMPLHLALQKTGIDPIELCSLLTSVMRDQKVDEPDEHKFTPLLYAASSGATICCMHLLQRGANIEAKEYRGNTPLNMAIYGGFDSCAIMLMQRNASLSFPIVISLPRKEEVKKETEEEKKKKKRPVLTWRPKKQWQSRQPKDIPGESMTIFEGAVKKDLTGVAHMLLDALGMPMEAVESALNLSKFYLALRLLRRIPDVSRLHAKNKEGQNLFHVLAYKTSRHDPDLQIKVAGALLEKRIMLAEKDKRGCTPLMYAALKHQSVALAKFLITNDLKFDARVKDTRNRDIMSAFMWDYNWVSDKFKVDEVKEWLDVLIDLGKVSLDTLYDHPLPDPLLFGASVSCEQPDYFDTRSKDLTSPLIFAIRNYDFGLAKYMLLKGANPNFADSNGLTPMMHAVRMNDVKMVKLLLNYTYELESDEPVENVALRPLLSKELSRQVITINFEVPKEKNPDDILDEEVKEQISEDDAVSLSKHSEENENSIDLEDHDDEEPVVDENMDVDDEEQEDKNDSDHDTDIVEDEEVDKVVAVAVSKENDSVNPTGAITKLSLTRHVSQMNKEREFTSIQKTSPVDLVVSDKNGWTAVHHAVCSLDHATFDNAEIVYLLGKAGAPLEAKNKAGETPMQLAQKTNAEKIVKVLNKLLVLEPYNKEPQPYVGNPQPFVVSEVVTGLTKPDTKADAEEMLKKLDKDDQVKDENKYLPKVDTNCEIKNSGEVARNPTTNIPYDVTLSKVDVSAGAWGMYNFYKMQVICHTTKNLFILFTRWGRIGDRGQFQHTPYQTLQEAAKEFCKIFKSKTGNDWSNLSKFQNHAKKYRLMPKPEHQYKQQKIEFNFESSLPSKLPEPVFDLLTEFSSVNMLLASVQKVGLNEDFMPFGRMKRETLLNARKILTDIGDLIEKITKLRNNLLTNVGTEYQSNCEEIAKLTNEYYHLIPIYGFEDETIQPIADKKMLRDHTKLLADLMDLEVANNILLGANLRKAEMNPMDYIYSSLDCRIQPLLEDDPEAQFILTNIHATVPTANINRIFKVSRAGEDARLAALKLPNHQLLWHGSSMSNFLSILSLGLLVTPPEVPWTGHLFGEGIYFADTFLKSSHYCHNHSPKSTCKAMLLCEVALGNPKIDVKHGDEDHLDDDINSLKILGKNAPVPDFDAKLPFGATLSLGQVQKMNYHPPARINHNEYIIHNADQVAIRYLVLYNG
ncbi:poly [ADP-ribose] polymerase tankyrase-like isoform X2 [Physella acuta]|uniref:poly [ADP-ribose] polymerase tankyrase-like isoform X2 n=1 Tax=Physella acuta TaxID=109671 RepID=UPI0027DCFAE9|nr:poly [ADP-ribose] polymerase tankyrase-like isoform X2 [Physella acuta]